MDPPEEICTWTHRRKSVPGSNPREICTWTHQRKSVHGPTRGNLYMDPPEEICTWTPATGNLCLNPQGESVPENPRGICPWTSQGDSVPEHPKRILYLDNLKEMCSTWTLQGNIYLDTPGRSVPEPPKGNL